MQRLGRQMDKWIRRPGRFAFAVFGRSETKNSQVLSEFLGPRDVMPRMPETSGAS